MRRLSSCLVAVATLAAAHPAIAQNPPTGGNNPPLTPQQRMASDRPYIGIMPGMQAEYETFLDSASGNNLGRQSLERIDLANRVSTLMELGRCTEARNEAREAGDRQMALRVRQLCRRDREPAR